MKTSPTFVREIPGGIELSLRVIPGAKRSEIVGVYGDQLKVKVQAPPERGKANEAVLKLLTKWLGCNAIEIVSGELNSDKRVRVMGLSELSEEQLKNLAE